MGTGVYFFRGGKYLRYDRGDESSSSPRSVAGNWPGLAESGIDQPNAAINLEAGKVYFFKDSKYVRYDINADAVDAGYPLSIADQWPGLRDAGFDTNIDAAV
ncbi:hemopexin repeat-containing protein, partial [Streptomyces sviceus]|uniref:hemopexin repeat-containing protein n=1 Tax=Streptomyces sviceus TaxID=285530 RepID=UPI0033229414